MSFFDAVTLACDIVGVVCLLSRRVPLWRTCGVLAVANGAALPGEVASGDFVGSCGHCVLCAALGAVWWHGGGGDGTRRRLRALRRLFRGVRRTAPAAGGVS